MALDSTILQKEVIKQIFIIFSAYRQKKIFRGGVCAKNKIAI